jgi:vacuolar-type H+-ATPase subunit I/STV1
VPEAGTVTIWGDTFDINGLNSGVVKLNIGVTPYYPPGPGDGIDWLQIALIAGAILVLIGAIFLFVPGIPPVLKTLGWVLLIIGIALLICYAVISMGLIKAAPAMIGGWLR